MNGKSFLFVVHTVADPKTAVYRGYCAKKEYVESLGFSARILTHRDFPGIEKHGRLFRLLYPFAAAFWIFKRKKEYTRIVFHSYSGWFFNLIRGLDPDTRNIKTITAFHGVEALYFTAMIRESRAAGKPVSPFFFLFNCIFLNAVIWLSCRFSERVLCLNRDEREYLIRHHYQASAKVMVVANQIKSEFFIPHEYPEKARVLLFAGQWDVNKGIRYLKQAFEILAGEDPDWELHIAGAMRDSGQVLQEFSQEVRGRVTVYPAAGHPEMRNFFKEADIFIFPSLTEAFANVILEAMAAGVPIISTRVGAGHEILEEGKDALFIQAASADDIVKAVRRLQADYKTRRSMGDSARKMAAEFSQEKVLSRWFEVITEDNSVFCPHYTGRSLIRRVKKRIGLVRDPFFPDYFEVLKRETGPRMGNNRFLLRVDDFPSAAGGPEDFLRFHRMTLDHQLPYMIGVTPFFERKDGSSGLRDPEMEILGTFRSAGVEIALHGFTHRRRDGITPSELSGMPLYELAKKLREADRFFEKSGLNPRAFIAPFNSYDPVTAGFLAQRFSLLCGGPESVLSLGPRMPSRLQGSYYLPSYRPLYDPDAKALSEIDRLCALAGGMWLPVTLHWSNGIRDDFRNFKELFCRMSGKTHSWEEFLKEKIT